VLDAGCGTGHTTVALARRLPGADFLGIDVSGSSVRLARELAERSDVSNIQFEVADIATAIPAERPFHAVLALGVLHHVPDRDAALDTLVDALDISGRLALWVYGVHGRRAHALHQRLIRLLAGSDAPDSEMALVGRAFVEGLGDKYLPGSGIYTPIGADRDPARWLEGHPEWLADQLFPPYERPLDLDTILGLFESRDLVFEDWFGVPEDPEHWTTEPVLLERLQALPRLERLRAIECLLKPEYYFVSARRAGPEA
jgi:SAM-dependent methyltransferase